MPSSSFDTGFVCNNMNMGAVILECYLTASLTSFLILSDHKIKWILKLVKGRTFRTFLFFLPPFPLSQGECVERRNDGWEE